MRCTLLINGVTADMPLEDAWACANMLRAMGRAVNPYTWVDTLRHGLLEDELEGVF